MVETCPVCGSHRICHNRVGVTTETWPYPTPELWIEGTLECLDCGDHSDGTASDD